MANSDAVAREFIARINRHDAAAVVALCTADHRFIDSLGVQLTGRAAIEQAWKGYFALFPDYRIELDEMLTAEGVVLMSGWASGSLASARGTAAWRIPAAWRARVQGELIAHWQVYADNKPVYELLAHGA